jgi:hypothetical protein
MSYPLTHRSDRQRQLGNMSPNVSAANGRPEGDRQRHAPLGAVVLSPPAMTLELYLSKDRHHSVTPAGCRVDRGSFLPGAVWGFAESPPHHSPKIIRICESEVQHA